MAVVKHNILDLSLGKMPMLKILLPYMLGIVLAKYYVWTAFSPLSMTLVLLALFIFITLLVLSNKPFHGKKLAITVLCSLFLAALGYGWSIKSDPSVDDRHFSNMEADYYIGVLDDEPVLRAKSVRFPLKINAVQQDGKTYKANGIMMVTLAKDSLASIPLQYGDKLLISNKKQTVNPPFNPKEFDYKAYLQNKNIWHQCYLQPYEYKVLENGHGNYLISYSLALRERLIEKFAAYMQHAEAFQVAIALIFGYRSQIDNTTLQAFSNTGTIHVLSVSGLHVGLVFVLLSFVLRWMDFFRYGRIIRCIIICLAVWVYVVLTGMAPPILRAGIMITFFLLSTAIGRKQVPLNTLATSALFILLFSPKALFDVGFQLSYMAMMGIFLLYPLMSYYYLPNNKYLRGIVAYSYVSIAAQLFTLPFVLYYFGQFPNYFLLANLFISVPSTLVMYIGIALAFSPLAPLSKVLGWTLDFLLDFCLNGLQWIESLPYSVIQGIEWSQTMVFLGTLFIVSLIIALNNTHKGMLFGCMLTLLAMTAVMNYQKMVKKRYSGWKIYNTRQAITFANIYRGDVLLFSSYDSLHHPNLLFSVVPDLLRYSPIEKIRFVPIPREQRQNSLIAVGDQRIAIIEKPWQTPLSDNLDILLWRKNNTADIDSVYAWLKPTGKIIFDGSNGDKYLQNVHTNHPQISQYSYTLKNNFAYVWNRK